MNTKIVGSLGTVPNAGGASPETAGLEELARRISKIRDAWSPGNSAVLNESLGELRNTAYMAKASLHLNHRQARKTASRIDKMVQSVSTYLATAKSYSDKLKTRNSSTPQTDARKSKFERVNRSVLQSGQKSNPVYEAANKLLGAERSLKAALDHFTTQSTGLDKLIALFYQILDKITDTLYKMDAKPSYEIAELLNQASSLLQQTSTPPTEAEKKELKILLKSFNKCRKQFLEDPDKLNTIVHTITLIEKAIQGGTPSNTSIASDTTTSTLPTSLNNEGERKAFVALLNEKAAHKLYILIHGERPDNIPYGTLVSLLTDFLNEKVTIPNFESKKLIFTTPDPEQYLQDQIQKQEKQLEALNTALNAALVPQLRQGRISELGAQIIQANRDLPQQSKGQQSRTAQTILELGTTRAALQEIQTKNSALYASELTQIIGETIHTLSLTRTSLHMLRLMQEIT